MSKMKHLLRKLHIGGPSTAADHHHQHHRVSVDQPSPSTSATAVVAVSTSSSSSPGNVAVGGAEPGSDPDVKLTDTGGADFNYFEEEFQMQMALAISVSDPDSRDDPETAQIKAAKQISLGCSPSQSLVELLSLRYWTYSVVNYEEKIVDGFYDVYGINSNSAVQGKMPMMVDLAAVSVSDSYDYEVILVNREADSDVRQLEDRVLFMSMECLSLRKGLSRNLLVQKIANFVVNRMGGPVTDAEEISKRWAARSYELRISLNSIVLPLGCLDVGLSRHRALLFKVLADKINLPCMLVKGSYYTGTDEGAVNIIKFDNGSEYIIDLMGAPGTLIPAEVPSSQLPNCGFHLRNASLVADNLSSLQASVTGPVSVLPHIDPNAKTSTSSADISFLEPKRDCSNIEGNIEIEQFGHKAVDASDRIIDGESTAGKTASAAQKKQVNDVSGYVITAAKNPEFAQKLRAVLLESGASPPPDLFSNIGTQEYGEWRGLQNQLTMGERVGGSQNYPQKYLSSNDLSLIPFTGGRIFSNPFDGSERNLAARGSAPQQLEVESSLSHTKSNSSDTTGEKLLEGEAWKVCDNMEKHEESATKEMQMASTSKPESFTNLNDQIDPILEAVAEWEILWEDLQIGERVGIGSYGEVYRAEWNGTEVAVKKFMNQDISGAALALFKCEVEIMSRLRHPNVVLFMGAVTRPPNLSILTEFLPRGSLYKLLHRPNIQLDEKRRMKMALDVAKGMNYLHTSHPVIVHRDLKTPNLLVDKNWVVKVSDFGMSRMKYHTFLSSKSTAGTAEWMAPEVLRNEPCSEKSDVYSFGVILWELATMEIPWAGMHSMQVVGAVGFQGKHLNIPPRVDPEVAELITDCWNTTQQARPPFGQIIARLKSLKRLEVPTAEGSSDQQKG